MIPAAVLARLGPWLIRAGQASVARAVAAMQKSGVSVNTVGDIVSYAKASPTNALFVFSNLAMAGFAVSDLFSPAEKQDGEARRVATSLAVAEAAAVDSRLLDIAGKSEELGGISGNTQDLVTLRRILKWAKGHYGSEGAAVEAFKSHQAFFELSLGDVLGGFEVLDV